MKSGRLGVERAGGAGETLSMHQGAEVVECGQMVGLARDHLKVGLPRGVPATQFGQ